MSRQRLRHAARVLRAGGIVAHATEGVWGLACDALNPDAVERVLALKHRDVARGLIVIAADAMAMRVFVDSGADEPWQHALQSWPGPTTWLLPAHRDVPRWLTGAHDSIALRQTAHAASAALCAVFDGPLVSTSANVSGRPPARSAWQIRARFGRGVDFVVGGTPDRPGRPSSIRDARTGRVVRPG